MAIGDSWAGLYGYSESEEGSFSILESAGCAATINSVPLSGIISIECSRSMSFGIGTCSINFDDPNFSGYNAIEEGNEIEIYNREAGKNPRKIWGGYVSSHSLSISQGVDVSVQGCEYSSKLNYGKFSASHSGVELSAAVSEIMGNQDDFTLEMDAVPEKTVSGDFTGEIIYSGLQKYLEGWGYDFQIGLDKVMRPKLKTEISVIADSIIEEDVVLPASEEYTKDYMCNDITVSGSGGASASYEDANSQERYGIYSKPSVAMIGLSSVAMALQYATQYVSSHNSPIPSRTINTIRPILDAEPGKYAYIDITTPPMSGYYQISSIKHLWGENRGWHSYLEISNPRITFSRQASVLDRRLTDIEKAVL